MPFQHDLFLKGKEINSIIQNPILLFTPSTRSTFASTLSSMNVGLYSPDCKEGLMGNLGMKDIHLSLETS